MLVCLNKQYVALSFFKCSVLAEQGKDGKSGEEPKTQKQMWQNRNNE